MSDRAQGRYLVYCEQCQTKTECTDAQVSWDVVNAKHSNCRNVWRLPVGDTLRDGTKVR